MTSLDTLAVHAGRADLTGLGVHALPLDLSTTNPLPSIDAGGTSYEAMATGGHPADGGMVYQRLWNPTVARFEEALARLEHTEAAVAYSTGMAAVTAALLAALAEGTGRHVVAVRPLYGGTDHLLASGLLGVETTFCAPDEVAAAVRADTCLVVLETPANPHPRAGRPRRRSPRPPATYRCWSTTPSPPRSCRTQPTTARRWCCTAPPSTSAATATRWAA